MKGGMLLAVLFVALCSLTIFGWVQPATAAAFGSEHWSGLAASILHGTNHTWNWNWWPWGGHDKKPKTRTVPVPGTLLLFGGGLIGFALWRHRQSK